jgi:hypothetical protein
VGAALIDIIVVLLLLSRVLGARFIVEVHALQHTVAKVLRGGGLHRQGGG